MTVLVTILPNLRRVKSILGLRVILATKIALEKKKIIINSYCALLAIKSLTGTRQPKEEKIINKKM